MVAYNGCYLYAGKILNHVNNNNLVYEKYISNRDTVSKLYNYYSEYFEMSISTTCIFQYDMDGLKNISATGYRLLSIAC